MFWSQMWPNDGHSITGCPVVNINVVTCANYKYSLKNHSLAKCTHFDFSSLVDAQNTADRAKTANKLNKIVCKLKYIILKTKKLITYTLQPAVLQFKTNTLIYE